MSAGTINISGRLKSFSIDTYIFREAEFSWESLTRSKFEGLELNVGGCAYCWGGIGGVEDAFSMPAFFNDASRSEAPPPDAIGAWTVVFVWRRDV